MLGCWKFGRGQRLPPRRIADDHDGGLCFEPVVVVVVVPSDPSFARIFSDVLPNGNRVFMCISYTGRVVSCIWRRGLFLLTFCALNDTLHDIHTSHMSNASVHTLHMPKPNVTRVQSATEWTASVHTLHMPKPNVTRVQSATEWTALYILYTCPNLM